ncbi:hypothetical protein [uncultured Shewanella sp.]|uniref:hypothetical protein n=1 Tax=uncultured Shewanella sp. TaxID=173975 RepID=UPI00261FD8DC|nr:hypothetical protein [uncultured Shewanella sp.]
MPQNVATAVAVQLSQTKLAADTNGSGAWSILVGPLTEPALKIKTEKGPALLAADVSLIYMGGAAAGSPPVPITPVTSSIKLEPKPDTKLINNTKCLLEKDVAQDTYGNILEVSDVSAKLKVGA